MSCRDVRELLSSYLDGRLSPSEAAEVEAHIEVCDACREELAGLRMTSQLLGSLPADRLSVDLAPALVARAASSRWRERWEAMRDFVAPRQVFVVRQLGRAAAVFAFFVLASAASGRGPGDVFLSWPGRVAGVAATGAAELTAGLAEVQILLGGSVAAQLPEAPATVPDQERPGPVRPSRIPSSSAVALNAEEGSSHVHA
ncbi:MAG: zf-HC2 domain-containing protein [Armatimonadota bacterium]|nr:MAG: zf-HC2 domain-containing protein [Armatimonadota bacterium]